MSVGNLRSWKNDKTLCSSRYWLYRMWEETNVLGIFTDKNKAWDVVDEHITRQRQNWSGQHEFDVYEVNEIDQEIRIEY